MVIRASAAIVDRARPATLTEVQGHFDRLHGTAFGARVLYLDDTSGIGALASGESGRIGRLLDRPTREAYYRTETSTHSVARHSRVALLNPVVVTGETVLLVRGDAAGPADGVVRALTPSSDSQTTLNVVTPGTYQAIRATMWVLARSGTSATPRAAPEGDQAMPGLPPEQQLSPWWIERIQTAASNAKRRHGMCEQIDAVVNELLAPVMGYIVIPTRLMGQQGYVVRRRNDDPVAWFVNRAQADTEAQRLNRLHRR